MTTVKRSKSLLLVLLFLVGRGTIAPSVDEAMSDEDCEVTVRHPLYVERTCNTTSGATGSDYRCMILATPP